MPSNESSNGFAWQAKAMLRERDAIVSEITQALGLPPEAKYRVAQKLYPRDDALSITTSSDSRGSSSLYRLGTNPTLQLLRSVTFHIHSVVLYPSKLRQLQRRHVDTERKNAELVELATKLQTANDVVVRTYRETLEAIIAALDARDNQEPGYSFRVAAYSQILAQALGIEQGSPDWESLLRGALLLNIGTIGVSNAVLQKPGKLDTREWREMKAHAEIGYHILRGIEFLRPASAVVRAHHERFDGSGYPLGLAGAEIPQSARVISVCDTFNAITSERPYRKAAAPEIAVREIMQCSGTQFDPDIVEVFKRVWPQMWKLRIQAASLADDDSKHSFWRRLLMSA